MMGLFNFLRKKTPLEFIIKNEDKETKLRRWKNAFMLKLYKNNFKSDKEENLHNLVLYKHYYYNITISNHFLERNLYIITINDNKYHEMYIKPLNYNQLEKLENILYEIIQSYHIYRELPE